MNIIQILRFDRLNNELHYQFHSDVIDIFNARDISVLTELDIYRWLAPYLIVFEREKEILDIIFSSKYTAMMADEDDSRDKACRGLIGVLKNIMLYHSDIMMREAAIRVLDILKHYGNITKRKYDEETAAIDDILREFSDHDIVDDINKLNILEWIEKMRLHNNRFKELASMRNIESAHKPAARMKETRTEIDKRFRNIVMHIEYKMISEYEENAPHQLTDLINELNSKITHYRNVIARKKTKKNTHEENNTDEHENE